MEQDREDDIIEEEVERCYKFEEGTQNHFCEKKCDYCMYAQAYLRDRK